MPTLAIQYPSFGPQHPPRLAAIAARAPAGWRVVAMEMFARDSDYPWQRHIPSGSGYERVTVVDAASGEARQARGLGTSVRDALDGIAPDVLVVNGWGHRESRISHAWAGRAGCPTVLLSDGVFENTERRWYRELVKRWVVRRCRSAFVAGTPQARYAVRLGIPSDRVFHPGSCVVDNEWWGAASTMAHDRVVEVRRERDLPARFFLSVARFLPVKNLPFVVRGFARFRAESERGDWGLVLIGDGPEGERVRREVERSGASGVVLAGELQPAEIAEYYAAASAFVLASSSFENWGLVVNEAMACGLPVLLSRMVGCAEDLLVEGENGSGFDPTDENSLVAAMASVAGRLEAGEDLGAVSRRIVAGHSCGVAADNLWRAVDAALR